MSILGVGDGIYPAVAYNFALQVEGAFFIPCKSVHSFTKENEYEYIQEGGLNDYVHMRRKAVSKPFTFQVERYVGIDAGGIDLLPNGTEFELPLLLWVNRYQATNATGVLGDSVPVRLYTFTGCRVTEKTYGELDAERSGLLIETVTIAYHQVTVVNNPDTSMVRDPWRSGSLKYAKSPAKTQKNKNLIKKWDPKKPTEHIANQPKVKQKNDKFKQKWDPKNKEKHIAKQQSVKEKNPKLKQKWDPKNKEKHIAKQQAVKEKNPKLKQKWDPKNKEKHIAKQQAVKEKNPKLKQKWDPKNKEKHIANQQAVKEKNPKFKQKWDPKNKEKHIANQPKVEQKNDKFKQKWDPKNKEKHIAKQQDVKGKNPKFKQKWDPTSKDRDMHIARQPSVKTKNPNLKKKWDGKDGHVARLANNAPKNAGLQRKWDPKDDLGTHSSRRQALAAAPSPFKALWPQDKRALMAAMLARR